MGGGVGVALVGGGGDVAVVGKGIEAPPGRELRLIYKPP